MKIETQITEQHHAHLSVEFEAELLQQFKQRAARQLSKRVKLPGFRPGKAPLPVVIRQVGEAAILEEAIEILVNEQYGKVIDEANIKPYGPGSVENIASTDPLTLVFDVPLRAEVELGDYKSVRKPYEQPSVADEEVEKVLNDLRERNAVNEPVERAVMESDLVSIKIRSTKTGEDAELFPERTQVVPVQAEKTVPEETDYEWPFPGFSRNLIGMAVGESKQLEHTWPEDSPYSTLRGASAALYFTVEEVKERRLPEVNDEFAQSIAEGQYADLAALRAEIREGLEHNAEHEYHDGYDEGVLEQIAEISSFKYAPEMVEDEIEQIINNLKNRLAQMNYDFDLYLKGRNMDLDGLKAEARPVAEKNLKKNLVLVEVARKENIQVTPDELQEETNRTLTSMSRSMPEKEFKRLNDKDIFNNFVSGVMADMLTSKAIERLRLIASDRYVEEAAAPEDEEKNAPAEEQVEPVSQPGEQPAAEAE